MAQVAQNSGHSNKFGRVEYILTPLRVGHAKVDPSGSHKLRVNNG